MMVTKFILCQYFKKAQQDDLGNYSLIILILILEGEKMDQLIQGLIIKALKESNTINASQHEAM